MPGHPSADDRDLEHAHAIAQQLFQERRNTIGNLADRLRKRGFDAAAMIARLENLQRIRIARTASWLPEEDLRFWLNGTAPRTRANVEVLAVLEGPVRNHIRATFRLPDSYFQETVPLSPAAMLAVRNVVSAVESEEPGSVPPAEFDRCQQALSAVLFGDRAMAALGALVERGQTVDLRLLPAGDLVEWPWEIATQEPRVDALCDTGMVGVSRLAAPSEASAVVEPARQGRPVRLDGSLDYACLGRELDVRASLAAWSEALVRTVGVDEFWTGGRPDAPAEVVVLTAHGKLSADGGPVHPERILRTLSGQEQVAKDRRSALLGCPLRVEVGGRDEPAKQVKDRILARSPLAVMLGVCYSATESAAVPSLGQLLATAGVPHVFAFRGKVDVEVIRQFTKRMTAGLREGFLPTHAAAAGRQAIDRRLGRTQLVVYGGSPVRPSE